MKRLIVLLFATSALVFAKNKDLVDVEVKASLAVTHEDQSKGAVLRKGLIGANEPTRQVESFNLDTVINGAHVLLACDDPRGCESITLGTYKGELRLSKWLTLTFTMPVTHKEVSRQYRLAGSW